jgi:hypothetical protein
MGKGRSWEAETMLQDIATESCERGVFAKPARCPLCLDWMVAPLMSEFVEGGEIRHHWVCESCGETSTTAFEFAAE